MSKNSKKKPEIIDYFLNEISQGRSQASICREEGMPDNKTIWTWNKYDNEFARRYAEAKEERGNYYGEKVAEIALGTLSGKIKPDQARTAIDGLKWVAGRMASKAFGDKVEVAHSGGGSYVEALKEVANSIRAEKKKEAAPELRARDKKEKENISIH